MPNKQVSAPEIRAAASFLKRRKLDLSPREFATAAKEKDVSFKELLRILAAGNTNG